MNMKDKRVKDKNFLERTTKISIVDTRIYSLYYISHPSTLTIIMIVLPGQPVSDNSDKIKHRESVYERSDKLISSTIGKLSKSEDVSVFFNLTR